MPLRIMVVLVRDDYIHPVYSVQHREPRTTPTWSRPPLLWHVGRQPESPRPSTNDFGASDRQEVLIASAESKPSSISGSIQITTKAGTLAPITGLQRRTRMSCPRLIKCEQSVAETCILPCCTTYGARHPICYDEQAWYQVTVKKIEERYLLSYDVPFSNGARCWINDLAYDLPLGNQHCNRP
jgi:hypothetical protein